MILIILLIFLPIILIHLLQKHKKATKTLVPPGPPRLPLIGNLHQLATAKSPHVYLWQLSKKYGPIIHMKLGSTPLIIISSSKLAKEVMKTQDLAFCSRPSLLGQQKISYNGKDMVFSPYNPYWKEVRRILSSHLFSIKKIQSFRPIREDEISRLVAKISGFSSCNQVVNLSEVAMALASTLICRTAFGKRYDEKGSESRRFDELLHDAQAIAAGIYLSDYIPMFGWMDKINGSIDKVERTCKNMDLFLQELIDEHVDPKREKEFEEEDDVLDVLIKIKEEKSSSIDFTWDHIKALLMVLFPLTLSCYRFGSLFSII